VAAGAAGCRQSRAGAARRLPSANPAPAANFFTQKNTYNSKTNRER